MAARSTFFSTAVLLFFATSLALTSAYTYTNQCGGVIRLELCEDTIIDFYTSIANVGINLFCTWILDSYSLVNNIHVTIQTDAFGANDGLVAYSFDTVTDVERCNFSRGHECILQGINNILVYSSDAAGSGGFRARISASPFCPVERYRPSAFYLDGVNGSWTYPSATGSYGKYERVLAVLPRYTPTAANYLNLQWINVTKESDWLNVFTIYPLHLLKNLSLERRWTGDYPEGTLGSYTTSTYPRLIYFESAGNETGTGFGLGWGIPSGNATMALLESQEDGQWPMSRPRFTI